MIQKKEYVENWRRYGTGGGLKLLSSLGVLPTRNWQGGEFEGHDKISFETTEREWPKTSRACGPLCPTPCAHHTEIPHGPYAGAHCDGPEYETLYAFGSQCGVATLDAIVAANQICDENGIDTISAGLTISFLTECFEKGLIDTSHTDGIKLAFGDDRAVMQCLEKIVSRQGAGFPWGEGTRRLSSQIPGSSGFAMHCKGLEMGGYESRGFYGQALQFAINPKGGDHHGMGLPARTEVAEKSNLQIKGKGMLLKNDALGRIIADSLVVCVFPRKVLFSLFPELLTAITGQAFTQADLDKIGMRIVSRERLFNVREGLGRADDTLPARMLEEPLPDGPHKGSTVPIEALKDDAYPVFGWDLKTGAPEEKLLKELGISP